MYYIVNYYCRSNSWVEWFELDTADTSTVDDLESHVSLLAPWGAPWVSHDPVISSAWCAPSNNICGMVKASSAGSRVENTTWVALENRLVSLNWDWKGLRSKCCLHCSWASRCNVRVASCLFTGGWARLEFASLTNCLVGVSTLWHCGIGLEVVESLILPTTVATVISSRAIN